MQDASTSGIGEEVQAGQNASPFESHCAGERQCEPTVDPLQHVSERALQLCDAFGVRRAALQSWATIHQQPHIACAVCTVTACSAIVVNTFSMLISNPWRWNLHSTALAYTACHVVSVVLLWISGPAASKTKVYYAVFVSAIFLQFQAAVRLMMGPLEEVPFQHRLLYACINAVGLACWTIGGQLGSWEPDHPPTPHRSLIKPLADTAIRTLRLSDAITDMLLTRLMLQKAKPPCIWLREPGYCTTWIVLACFAGSFTVLDLACGLALSMSGSGLGRNIVSRRKKLFFLCGHVTSLLCETGIIVLTFILLFSEVDTESDSRSRTDKMSDIALTVLSFLTTVASFVLSTVGLRQVAMTMTQLATVLTRKYTGTSCRSKPRSVFPSTILAAGSGDAVPELSTHEGPGSPPIESTRD